MVCTAPARTGAGGTDARAACSTNFAAVQMIDVHLPSSDGCELMLTRYIEPEPGLHLLLKKIKQELPAAQPPPKITASGLSNTQAAGSELALADLEDIGVGSVLDIRQFERQRRRLRRFFFLRPGGGGNAA